MVVVVRTANGRAITMNPGNPMLPERRQPRPQPDRSQRRRQTSPPAPVVSHRITAPVLSIDPRDIPIGRAVDLDGYTFVWNGGQFRNEYADRVIRSEWRRKLIRFLIALAVCVLATWWVMSGLDWDAMTLDERAPYKLAGRIVLIGLIVALVRLHRSAPVVQTRRLDRMIREREGIRPTDIRFMG